MFKITEEKLKQIVLEEIVIDDIREEACHLFESNNLKGLSQIRRIIEDKGATSFENLILKNVIEEIIEREIDNLLNEARPEDDWGKLSRRDSLKKTAMAALGLIGLGGIGLGMGSEKKGGEVAAALQRGKERAEQIKDFRALAQTETGTTFTTGPKEMDAFFAKHKNCIGRINLVHQLGKYFYAVHPKCIKENEILPFVQMSKADFKSLMYMTFVDFDDSGFPKNHDRLEKRVRGGRGAVGWWSYGGPFNGFNLYDDGLMMPPEWSATGELLEEIEWMMSEEPVQEMIQRIRNLILS